MKTTITALALLALAGTAFADPHETQTFAGPVGVYFDASYVGNGNPSNTALTPTFTGTGYTASGFQIIMDVTAVAAGTWGQDMAILCIPPSGTGFYLYPSDALGYTSLTDATSELRLPVGVNPVGAWSVTIFETYEDGDGSSPESNASNIRISLLDLPPVAPPAGNVDLGTLGNGEVTGTASDFVGGQVRWWKITTPDAANIASGYYVDINTKGTATGGNGGTGTANDTEVGLYDANGILYATNDDIAYPAEPESFLTLGSDTARDHGTSAAVYDGSDGDMIAGVYYIAAGTYNVNFGNDFGATSTSTSAGGSLVVNVFSNFPSGPTLCSPADIGVQGGVAGHDNLLDNNDFIVFIDYFFNANPIADVGVQGGVPGTDGQFDNNDFIVFIDQFFNGQPNCQG